MSEIISELNKVKAFIRENHMIERTDSIIVGLSGGADSVCLLDMLWRCREEWNIDIAAVHIHHGIRGQEADRDAEYARKVCEEREIKCHVFYYDVPSYAAENRLSEEEAGRKLRYETFYECRKHYSDKGVADKKVKIAVAHNLNDSVETFIHNLCRGTGTAGLIGIKAVNNEIIRPLLCLKRKEIENYLEAEHIRYISDSTNFIDEYTRNKIRLNVLPYLCKNINSRSMEHIYELSEDIAANEEYMQRQALEVYNKIFIKDNSYIYAERKDIEELDKCIAARIVRLAAGHVAGSLKDITRKHIEDILSLNKKQSGRYIMLPYNMIVRTEQLRIIFEKSPADMDRDSSDEAGPGMRGPDVNSVEINKAGIYEFGNIIFEIEIIECYKNEENMKNLEKCLKNDQKIYTKCFDYDKISSVALIRTRQPGDYIIVNSDGGTKKIKSYFIDEKIPSGDRERIPLIADGSNIIWVYGHRISEYYKVSESTRRILKITGRYKKE